MLHTNDVRWWSTSEKTWAGYLQTSTKKFSSCKFSKLDTMMKSQTLKHHLVVRQYKKCNKRCYKMKCQSVTWKAIHHHVGFNSFFPGESELASSPSALFIHLFWKISLGISSTGVLQAGCSSSINRWEITTNEINVITRNVGQCLTWWSPYRT